MGASEGAITDKNGGTIADATIAATNLQTGFTNAEVEMKDGHYRIGFLPVGHYSLTVETPQFARFLQRPIDVTVSQIFRGDVRAGCRRGQAGRYGYRRR